MQQKRFAKIINVDSIKETLNEKASVKGSFKVIDQTLTNPKNKKQVYSLFTNIVHSKEMPTNSNQTNCLFPNVVQLFMRMSTNTD